MFGGGEDACRVPSPEPEAEGATRDAGVRDEIFFDAGFEAFAFGAPDEGGAAVFARGVFAAAAGVFAAATGVFERVARGATAAGVFAAATGVFERVARGATAAGVFAARARFARGTLAAAEFFSSPSPSPS